MKDAGDRAGRRGWAARAAETVVRRPLTVLAVSLALAVAGGWASAGLRLTEGLH